ncbi:aldehyde dehydrogenase family protein, partial [Pseudomonas sp. SIMBA_067]|uniref:aldehyde dehydrogenase family protein n=1 Tax=Pseudomonas sp. SIMBA_067 TaxID=3085807 RepID=UPI003978B39E
ILNEVLEKITPKVAALNVANGFDENADIGPLIYPKAKEKVQQLIKDALDKGATLIGDNSNLGGSFQNPLIVTNATTQM